MERLYGSFDQILFNPASHSQLKDTDMINFTRGICAGMEHVANQGIVHRDLAARNILMAKDGTPKIADFGLSRQIADAATAGTTASNVGPIQCSSKYYLCFFFHFQKFDRSHICDDYRDVS
jgi:serine/threonine protein kinase